MNFFDRFDIRKEFLDVDPSLWHEDGNFKQALQIVTKLKVINDCAERVVNVISKFVD